ncbi:NAD(P)H-binding protein [Cryptosporangium arvum]|uniref:NAD(P)H-binding protein n=1 Tax=Cryptosporangium arvum TaxID=80871 RepID=UPI0004AFC851|nr:NAD(P)H-binding protein [Cryptosporangium arvum]
MIVITGATGTVGRPLVQTLIDAGHAVTAVARTVPTGVAADLARPETLRPALDGADAIFLLIAGDLLVDAGEPDALLETITAAGVRRVVLLSSQAARTRPSAPSHSRLRAYEDALRRTAAEWTVLRPGGFASNTFAWVPSVRAARAVAAPFADVALPVVDPADITAVAAAVLTGDGHAGRAYELTGPAAISPREQTAALAAALGEPVAFTELTRADARAAMLAFMPGPVVEGTLDILGRPAPDEQRVSPDVERVLGRPPRSYAEWAAAAIDAFR